LLDRFPDVNGEGDFRFDFECLIDDDFYFSYSGSFTEPPCTEEVVWFVRMNPIAISQKNYDKISSAINSGSSNSRPIQSLNDR